MMSLNAKASIFSSPGQQRCGTFYPPLGQSSFFCQRSLIHLGSHGGGVLELGGRKGTVRMCAGPSSSESSDFLEEAEEGYPGGAGPEWQLRIAAQSVRSCVMCAALAAAMAFPHIYPSSPVLAEEGYVPPTPPSPPGLPEFSELVGVPSGPPAGLPESGDYVAVPPGPQGELPEAPDLVSPPSPAEAPAVVVAGETGAEAAADQSVSGPLPPGSPQESAPEFVAGLSPIKDPEALLRYALPIKNKPIKEVQRTLEEISEILKVPDSEPFEPVEKNVRQSSVLLEQHKEEILADVAEAKKQEGQQLLDKLSTGLQDFQQIVEAQDRAAIAPKQKELLAVVGHVEEDMVAQFPYSVPAQFANKPWLRGRANLEMKVRIKNNPNIKDAVFLMTVDGYNAPVTAGNFIDLVVRRFYDGMQIQRADGFVVQTGDPDGPAEGFIDPSTGKLRTIPLEIMLDRDSGDDGSPNQPPTYNASPEELGPLKERTKLPFGAYGTLAMVRKDVTPDSASSQIFWLVKEIDYAPTPPGTNGTNDGSNGVSDGASSGGSNGAGSTDNALDGTYAVFGYVTQNEDLFADLKVGDVIESIKVTNGLDNLMNPSYRG